ncbi:hypothetical protein [Dipodfec virus UA06Rod_16]|uniref:Uncharacterized protein n=1 Tax=Dipodfec virus UA06Rod_16 TaxID=2929317 RepID=A0A976R8P6_9VIRU|nr:hypothetical protein [Dipodfec virus UA06Rod_16]
MILAKGKKEKFEDGVQVLGSTAEEVAKATLKEPLFEVTYRYLFKEKRDDGEEICFVQTVTGLPVLHTDFVANIFKNNNIVCAGREYVCSFDTSKVGVFESIVDDRGSFNKDNKDEQEVEE